MSLSVAGSSPNILSSTSERETFTGKIHGRKIQNVTDREKIGDLFRRSVNSLSSEFSLLNAQLMELNKKNKKDLDDYNNPQPQQQGELQDSRPRNKKPIFTMESYEAKHKLLAHIETLLQKNNLQTEVVQLPKYLALGKPLAKQIILFKNPLHFPETYLKSRTIYEFLGTQNTWPGETNSDFATTFMNVLETLRKEYPALKSDEGELDFTEVALLFIESLISTSPKERSKCGYVAHVWKENFNDVALEWIPEVRLSAKKLLGGLLNDSFLGLFHSFDNLFNFVKALSVSKWLSEEDVRQIFIHAFQEYNDPKKMTNLQELSQACSKVISSSKDDKKNMLEIFLKCLEEVLNPPPPQRPKTPEVPMSVMPELVAAGPESLERDLVTSEDPDAKSNEARQPPEDAAQVHVEDPLLTPTRGGLPKTKESLLKALGVNRVWQQEKQLLSLINEMKACADSDLELWEKFLFVVSKCEFDTVKKEVWELWNLYESRIPETKATCWSHAAACIEACSLELIQTFYLGERFNSVLGSHFKYEKECFELYKAVFKKMANKDCRLSSQNALKILECHHTYLKKFPQLKNQLLFKDFLLLIKKCATESKLGLEVSCNLTLFRLYVSMIEDERTLALAKELFIGFLEKIKEDWKRYEENDLATVDLLSELPMAEKDLRDVRIFYQEVASTLESFFSLPNVDPILFADRVKDIVTGKTASKILEIVCRKMRDHGGHSVKKKEKCTEGVRVLRELISKVSENELKSFIESSELVQLFTFLQKQEISTLELRRKLVLRKISFDEDILTRVRYVASEWKHFANDPAVSSEVGKALIDRFMEVVETMEGKKVKDHQAFKTKQDNFVKAAVVLAEIFSENILYEIKKDKKVIANRPLLDALLNQMLVKFQGPQQSRFLFGRCLCRIILINPHFNEVCKQREITKAVLTNTFNNFHKEVTTEAIVQYIFIYNKEFLEDLLALWLDKNSLEVFEKLFAERAENRDLILALLSSLMQMLIDDYEESFEGLESVTTESELETAFAPCAKIFNQARNFLNQVWDSTFLNFEAKSTFWNRLSVSLMKKVIHDFETQAVLCDEKRKKFNDHFYDLLDMVNTKVVVNSNVAIVKLNRGEAVNLREAYAPVKVYQQAVKYCLDEIARNPATVTLLYQRVSHMVRVLCMNGISSVKEKEELFSKLLDIALRIKNTKLEERVNFLTEISMYTQVEGVSNIYHWRDQSARNNKIQITRNGDTANPSFDSLPELCRNGVRFFVRKLVENGSLKALLIADKVLSTPSYQGYFIELEDLLHYMRIQSLRLDSTDVVRSQLFENMYPLIFKPNLAWVDVSQENNTEKLLQGIEWNKCLLFGDDYSFDDEGVLRSCVYQTSRTTLDTFKKADKNQLNAKDVEQYFLAYIKFLKTPLILGFDRLVLEDYCEEINALSSTIKELQASHPQLITASLLEAAHVLFPFPMKEIRNHFSIASATNYLNAFSSLFELNLHVLGNEHLSEEWHAIKRILGPDSIKTGELEVGVHELGDQLIGLMEEDAQAVLALKPPNRPAPVAQKKSK